MATHANSTSVLGIATALSVQADVVARTKKISVQNVADVVATLMQDIHGGIWTAVIDHGADSSFVLIRPRLDQPIVKPKRGEIA